MEILVSTLTCTYVLAYDLQNTYELTAGKIRSMINIYLYRRLVYAYSFNISIKRVADVHD